MQEKGSNIMELGAEAVMQESAESSLCTALLAQQTISASDIKNAQTYKQKFGGDYRAIFVRLGAISEENLLLFLKDFLAIPLINILELPTAPQMYLEAITASGVAIDWWLDQEVLAWFSAADELSYIAKDPLASSCVELLRKSFPEMTHKPFLIRRYDLEKALDLVSRHVQGDAKDDLSQLRELAEEAPVIEFVANLFAQALDQRASDIHVEPGEKQMEVRFRIDGILYNRFMLPTHRFPAIASRIKLISGIDISENRLPQDGRVTVRISGVEVDLRVSTAPGVHGESIVLRLLPKDDQAFYLQDLGLQADHYSSLSGWIKEANGIILVTGPTGSGKSTTLYAALEQINDRKRKIITVEDPVEFYLDGITQIQTHTEIGYTFARALRSIMRQDPDVVMIGEIRDKETAEIAIQASLTGHLVVSTLHTNNSISAVTRLIDMGVEPFLVATPLKAVMAQRLVRKLCPHCAVPSDVVSEQLFDEIAPFIPASLAGQSANWHKALGCEKCQSTGYSGRLGIYEMVGVSPEIQQMIIDRASEHDIWKTVRQQNVRSLRADGLIKAWQGKTSIEEVLRVASV